MQIIYMHTSIGYYPYERIMVKVAAETSVGLGPYSSVLDFNTSQNGILLPIVCYFMYSLLHSTKCSTVIQW